MKYDLNKCFLQEKVKCQTQRMNRSRSIMIKTTAINTNCSVMWLDIQKDVNENLGSPISREACTNNDHNYIEACTIKDDHSFVEALAINNNHSFVKACTINDDQSYVEACAVKDDHSFVDARAINDNHSFVRTCTVNGDQSYVEACTINNDHGCFEALDIDRSYGEACAINDDHSYAEACATNDDQFKIDAQISKKNLNVNNVFEYKHCLYQLNLNTGYSYRFARNIPLEKFVADKELSQYLAIHPRSEHTCCIQNRYGKEKTLEIKVPVQTIKCTPCSSNQMQLMRESNKIKKKMKYITKHHLIQSIKDGKICPKGKKIPMNSETKKYVIRKYHALWSKLNQKFGKKSKKSAKSQTNFLLGVDSNQTNVQIDNEEYELTFSDFKQMSETELRGIISELSKTFPLSDLTYNKEFLKCNVRGEEDMMFFLDDTDVPSLLSEENNLNNDSQNINFF
ncbi:uncharacterized protein [Battus philenor]|uniref:uncharacterized protein n=1 Tax=Battus philenor TaxID=42288 RepID=UPI0035CED772